MRDQLQGEKTKGGKNGVEVKGKKGDISWPFSQLFEQRKPNQEGDYGRGKKKKKRNTKKL